MSKQILLFVLTFCTGVLMAQNPVTGLPSQWGNLYGYEAIELSNGNHLYLGGRSSQGPITWNAYPGNVLDDFRFRYSNVDAAQMVYIPWNGHFSFQVSDNAPSYGGVVNWRSVMSVSRWGSVDINADLKIHDKSLIITNGGVNEFKVDNTGKVRCREIEIDLNPIPDYVFAPNYQLMPLAQLREYIETEKHLPNIPSACEYEERGEIALGELNRLLLEKVEELTLYTLQLEAENNEQATQLAEMQAQMKALQAQMQALQNVMPQTDSNANKK